MIDKSVLTADDGEYEEKRSKQKLNSYQMFIMFVKSTIGISVFAYNYVYHNSNLPIGLLCSAVFMASVIYGIMRVADFAEELEANSEVPNLQVNTYFELCSLVFPNRPFLGHTLGPTVLIVAFFSNFGYCVTSILALNTTLTDMLDISKEISSLIILLVTAVGILFILEPEKLIYLAYCTMLVVFSLLFISNWYAFGRLFEGKYSLEDTQPLTLERIVLSCGFVISGLEIVNFILNMRRMMKRKENFSKVGYTSLTLCSLLFVLPSLLLHITYGKELLDIDLYYKLFQDNIVVKSLAGCMCVVFAYSIIVNAIYNVEMLEKLALIENLLRDKEHRLSSWRILLGRLIFLLASVLTSYFLEDLKFLMAMVGLFLNSFIGLIVPGFIGCFRPKASRSKKFSIFYAIADFLLLVLGFAIITLYFVAKYTA